MKPSWLQWVQDHVRPWTWKSSPKAPTVWGLKISFPLGKKKKLSK